MQRTPATPSPAAPAAVPSLTPALPADGALRAPGTRDTETGARWALRYRRRVRLVDHAVVTLVVVLTVLAGPVSPDVAGTAGVLVAVGLGVAWAACLALYRTRDLAVIGSGTAEYKRVANACVVAFVALAVGLALGGLAWSPHVPVLALPLGTVGLLVGRRSLRRWLTARRAAGQHLARAVVVGDRSDVAYVVERLDRAASSVYDVVGAVLTDGRREAVEAGGRSIPVVGGPDDVHRAVWRLGAESVIVAGGAGTDHERLRTLAWQLEGRATELVLAARLAEVAGPRVQFRPVDGLPLVHVELPTFAGPGHVAKRAFDVVTAALALVLLSPVLAVLALTVRLDSAGPVLFRQRRVGLDGRVFEMLKFRTMVVDAEARLAALRDRDEGAGLLFKLRADPRVTSVGRVLRRWSLDELPQLWNVLRGEMSIVGPRPPLPAEVEGYATHVHRRLSCRPGLTGLWQVSGRSDLGWDEGVRLDLWYVENWSLVGDLVIVWRTVRVLLRHEGAY